MTGDDTASFLYLGLLALFIGGGFLFANRHRMGQMVQQAAIWAFIFIGTVLVIGNWDAIRDAALPGQRIAVMEGATSIEVPQSRDGHYYMRLEVNDVPVEFVVDTGATDLVLTREDAARAGIDIEGLRYLGQALTANGSVGTAQVRLDEVSLGEVTDRNVPAIITEGELFHSLLGMTYLQKFGRIEIADGTLRLLR